MKQQIYSEFCQYVDYLSSSERLPVYTSKHSHFFDPDSWHGLGYSGKQIKEFQDFNSYLEDKLKKTKTLNLPVAAASLVDMMKSDMQMFHLKLILFAQMFLAT